ncbi:MAG: general secretion pathway protein GspK [Candidatus Omnitrophica bacterium]|nr:general secretion pathway protein GspK [Candidatus Omnitrophota bacterium]
MIRFGARSGSLLLITLWLVVVLSVLAVTIARYLSVDVRLTKYRLSQAQASLLARSGITVALQRLMDDATPGRPAADAVDWLGDDWAAPPEAAPDNPAQRVVQLPAGTGSMASTLTVRMSDEERKINLNTAEPETLARLGVPEALAAAILDYRDPPDATETASVGPPYVPKDAPFAAPEELREIPGMTDEMFQALQQAASPWLEPGSLVNINTAGREALRAVGLSPALIEAVMSFRGRGHYFLRLAPDVATDDPSVPAPFDPGDSEFQNVRAKFGVTSKTFLVVAEGLVEGPVPARARVEAVVRRGAEGMRPTVLAWREGARE